MFNREVASDRMHVQPVDRIMLVLSRRSPTHVMDDTLATLTRLAFDPTLAPRPGPVRDAPRYLPRTELVLERIPVPWQCSQMETLTRYRIFSLLRTLVKIVVLVTGVALV